MTRSLRVNVCSNCFRSLLPLLMKSADLRSSRLYQAEYRRSISWGSLFGKSQLKPEKIPDSSKTPKSPDDKAKLARNKVTTSQLEAIGPKKSTPRSSSGGAPAYDPSSLSGLSAWLRQTLQSHGESTRPSKASFRGSSPSSVSTSSRPREDLEQSFYTHDRYTRNPFLSPLPKEQRDAMSKYIQMAASSKDTRREDSFSRKEPPVPWDTNMDKYNNIRQLLALRSSQARKDPPASEKNLAWLKKAIALERRESHMTDGTPDSHILQATKVYAKLQSSKLYRQLRDHHIRSLIGYTGKGSHEAIEADKELFRRIELSLQEYGKHSGDIEWVGQFWTAIQDSHKSGGKTISPLVKYILAREGFSPTTDFETGDGASGRLYNNFGRVNHIIAEQLLEHGNYRFNLSNLSIPIKTLPARCRYDTEI
jgi:hypothetical protein